MTLDLLLVDDETPARSRLRRLLSAHPDVTVVGEASNGREALELIRDLSPSVVFLDVEMPELGGLETAAALLGGGAPAVVFCTAYDDYAVRAFELSAVDYLLKPVEPVRLAATLARVRQRLPSPSPVAPAADHAAPPVPAGALAALVGQLGADARLSRLAVRTGSRIVVCDLATVSAVVARDHYAEVLWGDRRLLADDALDALEARLEPAGFLRLHRASLVNLRFVKELRREGDRKYVAVLDDPFLTELPVSREKLPGLMAALGLS